MFCPKCRSEYVEGILSCADCGTALVPELPDDAPEPPRWIDFEQILTTFNAGDIALIKSILDGEDIPYYFFGEGFNYMLPLVQPARLMVEKPYAEQAREALRGFDFNYTVTVGAAKDEAAEE